MTEEEAAEKLVALLNEIEAAGHEVGSYATNDSDSRIYVGTRFELAPPNTDEEPWEVVRV